jgi:small glutamine-rich tetratricopeptide repeat-containing protein alpha
MEVNDTHRKIVVSFLEMIRGLKLEDTESIDVAVQCLSQAFGVDIEDKQSQYHTPTPLVDLWAKAIPTNTEDETKLLEFLQILEQKGYFNGVEKGTPEYGTRLEKAKTKFYSRQNPYEGLSPDQLKVKGNECMTSSKYKDALGYYTKAAELDPTNHLYHANRAAANIHLKEYKAAISDCEKSIALNPTYAKSFSRLGTAQFYDNNFSKAADAYRKAVELDPENEGYKEDLKSAEEKLTQQRANPMAGFPGMGGMGGMDMSSMMQMMNNPQFMQMANQFMQNPEFNTVVQSFATQMGMAAPNQQDMQDFLKNMGQGPEALVNPADPNQVMTPFGQLNREALQKLQDEEIKNNPRLAAIVEDVRANGPGVFSKYMGDPEVMGLMSKFSKMFQGPPQGGKRDDDAPPPPPLA